jgi:class 3 adenylate cyclase/pimeloyl-ACP methyl ester carboxylesterase
MDTPRIQYVRTSDGVNIAFYAIGEGSPLLVLPAGLHQSIEFDWKISNFRTAAEVSARTFKFVRYDPRGCGLSDREVADFPLDAMVRDLEAVSATLGDDKLRVFAPGRQGIAGAAFAARHSEKLSHLVLWVAHKTGKEYSENPFLPLRNLAQSDWRLASETIVRSADNWDNDDLARESAEIMRASVDPSTYVRYMQAADEWDLSPLLPSITCRTLVIHPAANPYFPVRGARELTASIPNARLALVDTPSVLMPGMEVIRIAGRFFVDSEERGPDDPRSRASSSAARATTTAETGMTAILFADIVDSTLLTERLGDAAFRAKARELDGALRGVIRDHSGTPIEGKLLGDGVLAVFTSARQAIEAALACGTAGSDAGLPLHLGLHAGDVIREDNNVYGGAVNIASRISGLSAAGEVLVSETVRSLARTSAGVRFEDRGEQALKGVGEPLRVWAVLRAEA